MVMDKADGGLWMNRRWCMSVSPCSTQWGGPTEWMELRFLPSEARKDMDYIYLNLWLVTPFICKVVILGPCLFPIKCDFIKSFAKVSQTYALCMFLNVQDICHYQACLLIVFLSMPSSSVCPPFYIFNYFEYTTPNVMHVLIWSGLQLLDMFFTNSNLVDKKQKLLHVFLSVYLTSEK